MGYFFAWQMHFATSNFRFTYNLFVRNPRSSDSTKYATDEKFRVYEGAETLPG